METYRIEGTRGMELGLHTLGDLFSAQSTTKQISEHQRMKDIIFMAKLTEEAGLDVLALAKVTKIFSLINPLQQSLEQL